MNSYQFNFEFDNVITRPYTLDGDLHENQYIYYRKIKVDFKSKISLRNFHVYSYKETNINTNVWMHVLCEKHLCLGADYEPNINMILGNQNLTEEDKKEAIYHILLDYFSTCTDEHWDRLKAPKDKDKIDEYELFYCEYNGKVYHKSQMSDQVFNIHKETLLTLLRVDLIKLQDHKLSFKDYIRCKNCSYYNLPKSENKRCDKCGIYYS